MPPSKLYWPKTKVEFLRLAEEEYQKYLPLVRSLQLHQLHGLSQAVGIALDEFREAASKEDIKRGFRPPGTTIGRQ